MKKVGHYIKHYTPLFGLLLATLLGFWMFRYDRFLQLSLTVAVAIGYVFWGIIHHTIHKDLTLEIVLEYIAVATLGIIILFFVVIRA